jgi:hypothetical protein
MRVTIAVDEAAVDGYSPAVRPDTSGIGINYADQVLKPLKLTLPDGRKVSARRRGLKIMVTIGDKSGEAVMRRIEHGPDTRVIFEKALVEAARLAGATLTRESGAVHLDV